jgi:hypothetical protein
MVFAIIARVNDWLQPPYPVAGAIGPAREPRKRRWAPFWLGPPGWRASPPDRSRPAAGALWIWCLMGRLACTVHLAQEDNRPYDTLPAFDCAGDFSLNNGINPAALLERLVAPAAPAVVDTAPHEDRTDVRILESTGACDRPSGVLPSTLHVQGIPAAAPVLLLTRRRWLGPMRSSPYIFPQASGDPWSPAPLHRRQANVFDTQSGSFSNTPLTAYTLTERGNSRPQAFLGLVFRSES